MTRVLPAPLPPRTKMQALRPVLQEGGLDGGGEVLEGFVPADKSWPVEVMAYQAGVHVLSKVGPEQFQLGRHVDRIAQTLLWPLRQEPQDQCLERSRQALGQVARGALGRSRTCRWSMASAIPLEMGPRPVTPL